MKDLKNFTNEFLLDSLNELNKKQFWTINRSNDFKFYENFKEFLEYYNFNLNQLKTILNYYKANNKFPICPICDIEHFYFHQQYLRECCCKDHQKKYAYTGVKDRGSIFLDLSKCYTNEDLNNIYSKCSIRGLKEFYKELNLNDTQYLIKVINDNRLTTSQLKIILEYYFKNNSWPICEICGKEHVYMRRKKLYTFCSSKCGDKYIPKITSIKYKEKTGYDHHMKNPEFIEKFEKLNLERTGYKCSFSNPFTKKNIEKTNFKKYGVSHHMKSKEFLENIYFPECYKRFGVKCAFELNSVKEKSKQSYKEKTGFDYNMENPEVIEKILESTHKYKIYILNNKEYKIQGYEPQCLDYLINIEKIDQKDIILKSKEGKPTIKYLKSLNNKMSSYFPDIYIKSQNRIVEVKSIWTYNYNKKTNDEKLQACKDSGYNANIYIMNKSGSLLEII